MKQRTVSHTTRKHGFYPNDFLRGFKGDHNQGNMLLKFMGLPTNQIPFSVITLLRNRYIRWKDAEGNVVTLSFSRKFKQIECIGSYLERRKKMRVLIEWGEDEIKK